MDLSPLTCECGLACFNALTAQKKIINSTKFYMNPNLKNNVKKGLKQTMSHTITIRWGFSGFFSADL